jgi:hypothetical protein
MKEEQVRAIFLLAGVEVRSLYEIKNKYWPPTYVDLIAAHPWWLVSTDKGLIEIGWRKRVISIDWKDTGVTLPLVSPNSAQLERSEITSDATTTWPTGVHAWTYGKAVDYLKVLFKEIIPRKEWLDSQKEAVIVVA